MTTYLTDWETGRIAVSNPRLGLTFRLEWDAAVYGSLTLWSPFGGATHPAPLVGVYGLGLEPWVSRFNLAEALQQGEALRLEARDSIETTLYASVASCEPTHA